MSIRGSYLFRGVELNDGVNFFVDTRESSFDDANSANASYGPRKDDTPVLLGASLQEMTLTLNLHLVAANPTQLEARIGLLRQLFVASSEEYTLQRRLGHELYYRHITVGVRSLHVNRLERKASITLQTRSAVWEDDAEQSQQATFFASSTSGTLTINYDGNYPVEPIVEVTAGTVATDGPIPLYYREVEVYAAATVGGWPIKIVNGWDVSGLISAGKLRSDKSDISIRLPDGTVCDHYWIEESPNVLTIWARPPRWPIDSALVGFHLAQRPIDQPQIKSNDVIAPGYTHVIRLKDPNSYVPPAAGVLRVGTEYMQYQEGAQHPYDPYTFTVRFIARGVYSTTAADHYLNEPVLFPSKLLVTYGYSPTSDVRYGQQTGGGWPEMNYLTSSNGEWEYDTVTRVKRDVGGTPLTGLNWSVEPNPNGRASELLVSTPESGQTVGLVSTYPYYGGPSDVRRLVLPHPGAGAQRRMSYLQLYLAFSPSPTPALPSYSAVLKRVRSAYGQPNEWSQDVFTIPFSGATPATLYTGYLYLDSISKPATHYVIELPNVPMGGTAATMVRLTKWQVRWDGYSGANSDGSPTYRPLGSEKGLSTGEYPVTLFITNLNDASVQSAFGIRARMQTGQTGVVDCAEHSVSGAIAFNEVDYTRSYWLRLVPGVNVLSLTTVPGSGQITVKVRWRTRH